MCDQKQELKWIDDARKGDPDAFCRLYDVYRSRLFRYAFYRLGNSSDAEDAVSDCVLAAWRQIGSLREARAFPAWIFRIMSACCARQIRQQADRRKQVSLDAPGGKGGGESTNGPSCQELSQDSDAGDGWLLLQEALSELSDQERNIVLLSVVGGLKSTEIAGFTGQASGTVRSTLSRSLKKLRGYFL